MPHSAVSVALVEFTLERSLCSVGKRKTRDCPPTVHLPVIWTLGLPASFSTGHLTAAILFVESWQIPQVQLHLFPGHLANLGAEMLEVGLHSLCE